MRQFWIAFLSALFLLTSCAEKGRDDSLIPIEEVSCDEDLRGHSVAVILGSTQDIYFSNVENVEVVRLNSVSEVLTAVQTGIADFGASDDATLYGLDLEKFKIETGYYLGGELETSAAFRHEDTVLCNLFNKFINEAKENGSYDEMYERWTNPTNKAAVLPNLDLPKEGKTLTVGISATMFPFTFVNEAGFTGFEVEMLQRFSIYSGYRLNLIDYNFAGLITALNSGKIDAIVAFMTVTEERQKQVLFSDSYFPARSICFYIPKDNISGKPLWSVIKDSVNSNLITENRWKLLVEGLWETIILSTFSILFGTILGMFICLLCMSKRKIISKIGHLYVSLIQGIPMVVLLMFMFYVAFASTTLVATWVAIISFTLNFAAATSQMYISGILGVSKGQTEAGRALGLGKVKTFLMIVAPQALRSIIPVYKGSAISLVKETSIVGYIAIQDLTKVSDLIRSRTFDAFFPLIIISILYLLLAWILGIGLEALNKKTSPKHKTK